ncbi:MAG: cysteine--tRNA ligase [Anaerolineales bacterium]|nr:cysteine--tRNA ligase [Anaerolineales bacterium]
MSQIIYNTLSRTKEAFQTIEPGKVRMYVCGPTVYDRAHVGHAMSSLVFDVIRRYLEYQGYEVLHVMNYTDVEDKVIERANNLGMEPITLAEQYIAEYGQHLKDLNILPATFFPRASEEIPAIIRIVQGLEEKGYAYAVDGDVYFRVNRDADYGRLSRRKLEDMQAGFRMDVDERKENPADFALWKAAKPGEPAWDSPWGGGRPGWHIECTAMSLSYLGEKIDIHGGGNDLVFPHHENEIAQSESYTGKPFARYWVHNGMLQLAGEKMSKSLGNLISIDEFLADHEPDVFRMIVLNSHYRSPLTFNDEVIQQAESALERLRSGLRIVTEVSEPDSSASAQLEAEKQTVQDQFLAAMDDDFNAPAAMAALFDLVRYIHKAKEGQAALSVVLDAQEELRELAAVLGLRLDARGEAGKEAAPFIDLLIEIRTLLREAKQWELSDTIRDRLEELGITIEDTRDRTIWR